MSIKRRLLEKLRETEQMLPCAKKADGLKLYPDFSRTLKSARDLSELGLPRNRFSEYAEIYDGLLEIWSQLLSKTLPPELQDEIISVSPTLLQAIIEKTTAETHFKKEFVFLPYKVSMWDSLESVWRAAVEDADHCIAYVIPIPYCDRNEDGTPKEWHYEKDVFPADVPVLDCEAVDLAAMHPDAIFIHNPYDGYNFITSIDARYFSDRLKTQTDLLVYIPYYVTTGGMAESQDMLSAYRYVDYIIVQSEKLRHVFHPSIPMQKIVGLGSPKLDKVLRLCQNPPEPPKAWTQKLHGRKVYFYNTSLNGMLANTPAFLQKMKYVFDCFEKNKTACLLWRPHPLLETTLKRLRPELFPAYERLKSDFIKRDLGIYDDTPEIEPTIAISDAYIGDSATSVTALFGLAGKPIFLFNNLIHTAPAKDDWRGSIIQGFAMEGRDWMITQGDKLYHAPNHDFHYRYYCDLAEFSSGGYYAAALELNGKVYVCPANAQDILIIGDHKIERRIPLERRLEKACAFRGPIHIGDYLFLMPHQYPAIVRLDLRTETIDYIRGYNDAIVQKVQGVWEEWRLGGLAIWGEWLLMASPTSQKVIALHSRTLETKEYMAGNLENTGGCLGMVPDGDEFWMLPHFGRTVTRWNPSTGEYREYTDWPADFCCHDVPDGDLCNERPFGSALATREYLLLVPLWGNKFLRICKKTGVIDEWTTPFPVTVKGKNEYFYAGYVGGFSYMPDKKEIFFRYGPDRTLYRFDMPSDRFALVEISFDKDELDTHTDGFTELSEWFRYGCVENVFNTLPDFIAGKIKGAPHDRARQIRAFSEVAANADGSAGEKIYRFIMEKSVMKEGGNHG